MRAYLTQPPEASTYVQNPPYFEAMDREAGTVADIENARIFALLSDSITTDHISPAGATTRTNPADLFLQEQQITPRDFNSYGSWRSNYRITWRPN